MRVVIVVIVVVVIVVVTGGKQSQLLALALGLGLGWSLTILGNTFGQFPKDTLYVRLVTLVKHLH